MRSQQPCPQCTGIVVVPAVDALVCPHCGAINRIDSRGTLTKPTDQELDQLLTRPDVRRVIEQASAIRQALFGGQFTLCDPTALLEPESHPTLSAAIAKANNAPWTITPWMIVDPSGHVAAHRPHRKDRPA
ncbi:hypothetical protein J1770_gp55 [Gordonia phage EMoore]|uniref:Uncharacterized protein n=1 Tax=Gordonia phage EMoore TaxID=2656534 RepID=A0A649VUA0_9CAUD|nr:hypothetical protein J1770_gp55 [Gordonia phage EMoore]QGJ95841.1 hypothetical protein SEA_EMOORE_55 [Gordonia phage EMoore]